MGAIDSHDYSSYGLLPTRNIMLFYLTLNLNEYYNSMVTHLFQPLEEKSTHPDTNEYLIPFNDGGLEAHDKCEGKKCEERAIEQHVVPESGHGCPKETVHLKKQHLCLLLRALQRLRWTRAFKCPCLFRTV